MYRLKAVILSLAYFAAVLASFTGTTSAATEIKYTFFYGQGCPHCAKVESYFQKEDIYRHYRIDKREIYFDSANARLFNRVMSEHGIPTAERGVPVLVAGTQIINGDEPIINYFKTLEKQNGNTPAPAKPQRAAEGSSKLSIPLVIGASLVDAINPCAFAVLFILLTTVLAKKGTKRHILLSGLAFAAAIFASYTLMGLGVYKALGTLQTTTIITTIVGTGAVVLGIFNLKDWLWYGKYFKMEVPEAWRPRMKSLIMSVTSPGGAFAVGLLVSLFLLPCSSGPYLVVLGLLAENSLDTGALAYLLLYNAIFVLPMLIITALVYEGSSVEKMQRLREQHLRTLHLIAGLILIGLGIFILL